MDPILTPDPFPLRVDENGDIRVGKTRVLLDMIVYGFREGDSLEAIAAAFGSLELPDVYATVAYYLRHREEIDAYMRGREESGERLRNEIEGHQRPRPTRQQLLSRQAKLH